MRKTSAFLEPMFAVASVLSPTFWSDGDYALLPTACMPYLGCIQVWLCLPVSRVKTWFQIERIGSTTPKNRKVKEMYFVS